MELNRHPYFSLMNFGLFDSCFYFNKLPRYTFKCLPCFLSPVVLFFFAFGHIGERWRWEHLSSNSTQPYSFYTPGSPRQWGCHIKRRGKLVPWWTAETIDVIWVYAWSGFTSQCVWWIISWALTTLHSFLCVRDFPSEVFRKNCTEFLKTPNSNEQMKKHLRFERLSFSDIPGLYKYIYFFLFVASTG